VSTRAAVVWTPEFLGYDLGDNHPLDPVRLDLTMRLATELGVLEGVEPLVPTQAPDEEVQRVHVPSYLTAVKSAPEIPFGVGHGLGTEDNPIFYGMHEASALVCGGSLRGGRARSPRAGPTAPSTSRVGCTTPWPTARRGSASTTTARWPSRGCSTTASTGSPTSTSTSTTATACRRRSTATRGCSRSRCTSTPSTLWPGTGWPGEYGADAGVGYAVNVPLPPGTADAGWLRAFHAIVPSLLTAFRPQILVTQCGVDTHAEDPLANLGLSVDGHRAIYLALRELAEEEAGGKWLAVGGGGYGLFRVVPRSWTHLVATVLDRDVEPNRPVPAGWVAHTARLTGQQLPTSMTDGHDTGYEPWTGGSDRVDAAVLDARRAVFPLHGLDPDDPRD
jgi:Deacetylases, including yeast histone deacetylase and acetoin utilization protein